MEKRLYIKLDMKEYHALLVMARDDLRESHDQLRHILREEAQRRGLLVIDPVEKNLNGGTPCLQS